MKSLLVGTYFHPPAKLLISLLANGTPLTLIPEPENPIDPNAIKVMVEAKDIPPSAWEELRDQLPSMGLCLADLSITPMQLGHVAKSSGKPLERNPECVGTIEFLAAISEWPAQARLGFTGDGRPTIEVP